MRILILGGDGMLGHQLYLTLHQQHDVKVTLRQDMYAYQQFNLFDHHNSYAGVNVCHLDSVIKVFADFKPDAVINAVGIVKQRKLSNDIVTSLEINAHFPHRLALLCKIAKARLIHISTDCVFSGRRGNYTEEDVSDAEDIYGKSKYLGEVHDKHCITLRSSIIGLELSHKTGLIEWFLAQKGQIKGFKRAIYSGLTTQEMSRLIERILVDDQDISGVWHVASQESVSKYKLLDYLSKLLERDDIIIEPDQEFSCDRSLNGDRFKQMTGYVSPTWQTMLQELAHHIKMRQAQYVISQ